MALSLTSCSPFSSKKPPLVLVLVESLEEGDYLCSEPLLFEGLEDLKQECGSFLRFTRVFAPSPLLQPQLASLMSGKELTEHGVLNNGVQAISADIETAAERAIQRKMRTAFYSGGVPLQPKFGITQGFEVFNDSFDSASGHFFRPFSDVVSQALRWLDSEVAGRSFFLTLYAPDMLSREVPDESSLENERPIDRSSRLRELYQNLDFFIAELKKRKRWEKTHFVFLGLGGSLNDLNPGNKLGSQLLQVPFQVKLARGVESNLLEIGENLITFPQIGSWIQSLIDHKPSQGKIQLRISDEELPIRQQSHFWPWLGLSHWPHLGLRYKQYLFTSFDKLEAYDSFADRNEVESLSQEETRRFVDSLQIQEVFSRTYRDQCHLSLLPSESKTIGCSRDPQINSQLLNELKILYKWSLMLEKNERPAKNLQEWSVHKRNFQSAYLNGWMAAQALRQREWAILFELGQRAKKKSWILVSQMNFHESPNFKVSGCLSYFTDLNKSISDFYKNCQDSELRKVVEGLYQLRQKKKASESFWAQVSSLNQRRRAKIINLQMMFKNDIDKPFDFSPSLAELYFFLPENSRFLGFLDLEKS